MKKLIAISVMMALVAGAAFAETSVFGGLEMGIGIAENAAGNPALGTGVGGLSFGFSAANDEGTYGGRVKFDFVSLINANPWDTDGYEYGDWAFVGYLMNQAYIWWKPIDQVKILFGKDGDGWFNPAGVSAWGYHKGAVEVMGLRTEERWGVRGRAILGNWDVFSLASEIKPIDNLTVNVGIRLPSALFGSDEYGSWDYGAGTWVPYADPEFKNVFKHMQLQAGYSVDGIGNFWVTFQAEGVGDAFGISYHTWSLLDGLALEAGFAYKLTSGATDPIGIAVGADYDSGADWGVKFKTLVTGFDDFVWDYVCFMPWYDFGFMKALFNVEIDNVVHPSKDIAVTINPYVTKDVGGGQVAAGFTYNTDTEEWGFAVGMNVSF